MPTPKLPANPAVAAHADRLPRPAAWTVLAVAIAATLAVIGVYVPAPLVLPAASVLLVGTGFAIAAAAGVMRLSGLAWDVAGALVFLGIAAALMADDAEALALLGQLEAKSLAALTR